METEYGGYHKLLRLKFEMDISVILTLAIIQTVNAVFSNLFSINLQNI